VVTSTSLPSQNVRSLYAIHAWKAQSCISGVGTDLCAVDLHMTTERVG